MSPYLITCPSCLRTLKQTAAGSLYCEVCGPVWIPDQDKPTCPQCGAILDGLFLCGWCEREAEQAAKNAAYVAEFTIHRHDRPAVVRMADVVAHWSDIGEQLR